MAKVSDVYGGDFVKAAEIPTATRVVAVITGASAEEVGQNRDVKLVLNLRSSAGAAWPRRLVLNKTNSLMLAIAYGDDTDHWIDKAIELWSEPTQYQGKDMMGIRLAALGNGADLPQTLPAATGPAWNSSKGNGGDLDDAIPF
jgi:hypothetical protein